MEKDNLERVRGWIQGQVKYYICFCKVALFVTAAIFCHMVVNYNVLSVLVTYFTATLKKDTIRRSTVLVNMREGLQILLKAGVYAKRSGIRKIIIFSTAAYILGLMMLYLSALNRIPNTNFGLYMFIVVLIAVGQAGGVPFLKTYLLDELIAGHETKPDINYDQAGARRNIWLFVAVVLLVLYLQLDFTERWSKMFLNSMCMVGAASFFILLGSCLSHQRHRSTKTENTKRHGECPDAPDEYDLRNDHETLPRDQTFKNDGNQLPESSTASAEAEQKRGLSSVKQVNVAKLPLRMIPMWSAFIVPGLVMSTADTFFIMQVDSMDAQGNASVLLLAKDVLKSVVVADLCKFLVSRRISRSEKNLALKMIICLGMMFSVILPSVAWRVEVQRLKIVQEMGLQGMSEDTKVPMSDRRPLAPLFCLWALMEGAAISGLDEFFSYHVSKSMEDYGSEVFNTIPIGIGSLLSVVCVSACKGWFGNTLNQSRLDNYYRMITVMAWINLCWFFFVSTFYSTKEEVADERTQQQEIEVEVVDLEGS